MMKTIKIANAQAFWGDRTEAASELMEKQPDLDFITLDYLSEVSLSIMAVQRLKDPKTGYAKDFVEVIKSLIPYWKKGSKVKIISNAGGLCPQECAKACLKILSESNIALNIAVVDGDDVIEHIKKKPTDAFFNNLETKESIYSVIGELTTANAYLGAKEIVAALDQGADIVVTGRIADPSMVVAPCVASFKWSWTDYDKIAQATVAGHLIECGTQVTGGISADWLNLPCIDTIGFPFVEVDAEGEVIVTKPKETGGKVTVNTVKEQLLYEIGDPNAYLSPDVTVSFLSLRLEQIEKDRVSVKGAKGIPPPPTYKVSATYRDGYKAEGLLGIVGVDCEKKARRAGEVILAKMKQAGLAPQKALIECLGNGDIVPGVGLFGKDCNTAMECVLRVCVADPRIEVLENFAKQIAPLVTAGPAGTTGYTTGRPHIRPVFGYWPCLISVSEVSPKISFIKELS